MESAPTWVDEIGLDPTSPWPQMGTRALGERPWLVRDDFLEDDLALREQLLAERPDEVLAEPIGSGAAAAELEALVVASGVRVADGSSALWRLGLSVQEDFCLLERQDEWILRAAVLCFPSRWCLRAKLDKPLTAIHAPTPRYEANLASRVTSLLDRLGDRVVHRRNWFVHPDPSLFQPDRPEGGDPVVHADRCDRDLHVRSERQTLRRLPESGWVAFTIRIQQVPLGVLTAARADEWWTFIDEAPEDLLRHKGIASAQAAQLRAMRPGS